jgi:hypothetical protein
MEVAYSQKCAGCESPQSESPRLYRRRHLVRYCACLLREISIARISHITISQALAGHSWFIYLGPRDNHGISKRHFFFGMPMGSSLHFFICPEISVQEAKTQPASARRQGVAVLNWRQRAWKRRGLSVCARSLPSTKFRNSSASKVCFSVTPAWLHHVRQCRISGIAPHPPRHEPL